MGVTPPQGRRRRVKTQWHRGVFDKQRADDGSDALREWLMTDNYLQAEGRLRDPGRQRPGPSRRVPDSAGPRSDKVVLAFEGASGIDPDELDKIVEQQKLERKLFTDPLVVTELLERYYREQGYLAAEIDEPRYEYQGAGARGAPGSGRPEVHARNVTCPATRSMPPTSSCRSFR